MDNKFELGEQLKDIVTGFEGIAVARIEYLNGCVQYGIKPKLGEESKKKGDFPESQYIDVEQLERIGDGIKAERNTVGGPGDENAPDRYSV